MLAVCLSTKTLGEKHSEIFVSILFAIAHRRERTEFTGISVDT